MSNSAEKVQKGPVWQPRLKIKPRPWEALFIDTDAFLICIKIRQFQLRSAYLALSTYHFYTSNRNHLLHNSVLYTFAFLCII